MNPALVRSLPALVPGLTREGITWSTTSPGLVEIRIDLQNDADRPTEPADLVIETAGRVASGSGRNRRRGETSPSPRPVVPFPEILGAGQRPSGPALR